MTFDEALGQLKTWCTRSAGRPIAIGTEQELAFRCAPVDATDIERLEERIGWPLPAAYRELLRVIGEARLFIDRNGLGVRLYAPGEVVEMSEQIWESWEDERATAADRFCIIGHHSLLGDPFGFLTSRPGPANFDVFCHEYPPFEYAAASDETGSWTSLDAWIIRLVETGGREVL